MSALILLSLTKTVLSTTCPIYNCGSSTTSGTCWGFQQESGVDTYTVTPCIAGLTCSPAFESNSTCKGPATFSRYPGSFCSMNVDCMSNNCIQNVCQGLTSGQACSSSSQCNPGLYCGSNVCTAQLKFGSQCTLTEQCVNNALCDYNGLCVEYFSGSTGDQTVTVLEQGLSPACQSGFSVNGKCAAAPQSNETTLMPCVAGTVCLSKNSVSSKNCTCGYDGNSYCPLFEGDSVVKSMINSVSPIFALSTGRCHTNDRLGPSCFATMSNGNQLIYWKFIVNANLYLKNEWIYSNNDSNCINQTAEAGYWNRYYQSLGMTIQQCPQYNCASNTTAWANNQCVFQYTGLVYDAPFQSIQVNNCSEGTLCSPGTFSQNSTCQATSVSLRYPGDYCTSDAQCYSSTCFLDICMGQGYGEPCASSTDCIPRLYCATNKTCQYTLEDDEDCVSDDQCGTYSLCINKLCNRFYSMPVGSIVSQGTYPYGYSPACETGFAAYNNLVYTCENAPVSNGFSTVCDSNNLCRDTTTGSYPRSCSCGFDGEIHCPAFEGDANLVNAIHAFRLMSETDYACNSGTKFSVACLGFSASLATEYYIYYTNLTMYENYISLQSTNATCFRNVTNTGYWAAYNYLHPQPTPPTPVPPKPNHSSSQILSALITLLLVNL